MATRLLWQHLFWFFGHPEVYIIFLPATGFVSVITETFCRRPVFAYPVVVLALISTGILAFGLWVHHMFATGLPRVGYSFYTAASMTVAIPTGLQIFCWLATMWDGRPALPGADALRRRLHRHLRHRRPDRRDGRRGAARPQLHDTYFIVAHFHYVLIGGAVFPLLGILTYWYPEDHRPDDERDARQDRLLDDVPRLPARLLPDAHQRACSACRGGSTPIPPGLGLELPNLLSTIGAFVVAARSAVRRQRLYSLLSRRDRAANPWGAASLEWATSSPPPVYNFAHIPVVESRTPLWD
jgi:heme/copper-type cytochrome/quinol oxidase subunit 1